MFFYGWSDNSDWFEYIPHVFAIRRITHHSWSVDYRVDDDMHYLGFRYENIIVMCDHAFVEVTY